VNRVIDNSLIIVHMLSFAAADWYFCCPSWL